MRQWEQNVGIEPLETFDFTAVPMLSKAHVSAITAGDSWISKGSNILLFGPPGVGKSHLGSAIGLSLIENGYRVLFTRTPTPCRRKGKRGLDARLKGQRLQTTKLIDAQRLQNDNQNP
jgi:MoxR-like ATPase